MIDSHQHFWNFDPVEYPWIGEGKGSCGETFSPRIWNVK